MKMEANISENGNWSIVDQIAYHRMPLSLESYAIATTILCTSMMVSTPGNILMAWVVIKTPFLRSKAVNMLIVNLCFIDLVACCVDMPLIWTILQLNNEKLANNKWLCNWQLFIHTMSIAGQILSFVSVGYERYHTVSNPFDKEKVRKITHVLVMGCWLISLLIALIEIIVAADTVGYNYCVQSKLRSQHKGIIYIMLPFGVACFVLVAFFYGRIVWLVRKHCKYVNVTCRKVPLPTVNGADVSNGSELPSIYGEVCVLDTKNRSLGKRRIEAETAKKSFFVIVSFVAFTLPYPVVIIVEKIFKLQFNKVIFELEYCLNILSIMSAGLNPIVYGLANRQFRNAFCKICHRYYRRYKSREL